MDRSGHAVGFPRRPSAGVPALDEAVVVVFVPGVLASTETRDVMQYLRMTRGKCVHRPNDLHRACRCVETHGQRWQFSCVGGWRSSEGDGCRFARWRNGRRCCRRLGLRGLRRWRCFRLTSRRAREENDHRDPRGKPVVNTRHLAILAADEPGRHRFHLAADTLEHRFQYTVDTRARGPVI